MSFLKKNSLLFVVFATGASVLIVEVVAVRVLSPFFGNTIYTVSSVISVILAALSLGYYFGGRLADRRPSLKYFYGIVFLSGLSILSLQLLSRIILPIAGYQLSIVSGPLLIAAILFLLPGFLLGTLSPFAIKLLKKRPDSEGVGSVAGKVFFWSTLGSIVGSLAAGFLLIPHFGIDQIFIATGLLLILIGLIPLIRIGLQKKNLIEIIIIIAIIVWSIFFFSSERHQNIVYSRDGFYEKIVVLDEEDQGRPIRVLQQDRSSSGAIRLDTEELVFDYTKHYILYQLFTPNLKQALFIGGGAYSVPKVLLAELPKVEVDVVEIEPSFFQLAKEYFKVSDDPRLKNHLADGRRFLTESDKNYDLIFSDVFYSLYSIPPHHVTREFFQLAETRLNSKGICLVNFMGNLTDPVPSLIFSEIKTFKSIFPNSYFFAVESRDSQETQNIIAVGYKSKKRIEFKSRKIRNSKNQIIRSLNDRLIDLRKVDFDQHLMLTDNHCPVEYLTGKLLRHSMIKD